MLNLAILSILTTIIWIIFASGYVRYGMFIAIVYFIIEAYFINKIIQEFIKEKNNYNILQLFLKFIVIFIILIQIIISIGDGIAYMYGKIKFSISDFSAIIEKDTISGTYDIDGVWIASRYNIACIDLIRSKDDPMYNADLIIKQDPMMNVESSFSDYSKELFYEKIKRKENVYNNK